MNFSKQSALQNKIKYDRKEALLCLGPRLRLALLCCDLILDPWPLSCGVWQESGLASWIGGHLQPLAEVPPAAAVMLITGFLACFTEFASNTATIIIFLPVIAELVRLDFINLRTCSCCVMGREQGTGNGWTELGSRVLADSCWMLV